MLSDAAVPEVQFRDQHSAMDGTAKLLPHIGAAQRFMPGLRLKRDGDVRHCQGPFVANWTAVSGDRTPWGCGINVFHMAPDGRLSAATGLWG